MTTRYFTLESELEIAKERLSIMLNLTRLRDLRLIYSLGYVPEEADSMISEYKNFLIMKKLRIEGLVPTRRIDLVWHEHILDTRSYADFCEEFFGNYLHHNPYMGLPGDSTPDYEHARNFSNTRKRYFELFGEELK